MVQTELSIRERRPEELPREVEIFNSVLPADWRFTVEQLRDWESLETPEDTVLRLLAFPGSNAVGVGQAFHLQHYAPGRFQIDMAVLPELQRRGIGTALYRRLLAFVREQGGQSVEVGVREPDLPRVQDWLEREGFRETTRMRESELRLADFDPAAHAKAEERAAASGITFLTLSEDESEASWRKLWELSNIIRRDIPYDGPRVDETYERFRRRLSTPECLRDCTVIAREGERYVGLTVLGRSAEDRASTWTTGVHPEYRGRGIATAVKARSARLARERGYTRMRTVNHTNNPAMLAVNTRLGYQPLPEIVDFVKELGG